LNDLARLIEREPSLTVNLLRLANSAAFSSGREVKTVAQATVMLGSRVIRNISIAHAVTALRKITDVGNFDIAAFWSDSLRRACSALVLARVAGYEDPSEAFTVGLIQDLGVLLFATSGHGDRIQTLRGLPAYERIKGEVEVTGKSHMEEFVALARAWGLPKDLVDAVSMHHSDSPGPLDRRTARLSQLARAADLIADITQTRAAADTLARARALLAQTESRAPLDLQKIVDLVAQEMVSQSRDLDIRMGRRRTCRCCHTAWWSRLHTRGTGAGPCWAWRRARTRAQRLGPTMHTCVSRRRSPIGGALISWKAPGRLRDRARDSVCTCTLCGGSARLRAGRQGSVPSAARRSPPAKCSRRGNRRVGLGLHERKVCGVAAGEPDGALLTGKRSNDVGAFLWDTGLAVGPDVGVGVAVEPSLHQTLTHGTSCGLT